MLQTTKLKITYWHSSFRNQFNRLGKRMFAIIKMIQKMERIQSTRKFLRNLLKIIAKRQALWSKGLDWARFRSYRSRLRVFFTVLTKLTWICSLRFLKMQWFFIISFKNLCWFTINSQIYMMSSCWLSLYQRRSIKKE